MNGAHNAIHASFAFRIRAVDRNDDIPGANARFERRSPRTYVNHARSVGSILGRELYADESVRCGVEACLETLHERPADLHGKLGDFRGVCGQAVARLLQLGLYPARVAGCPARLPGDPARFSRCRRSSAAGGPGSPDRIIRGITFRGRRRYRRRSRCRGWGRRRSRRGRSRQGRLRCGECLERDQPRGNHRCTQHR